MANPPAPSFALICNSMSFLVRKGFIVDYFGLFSKNVDLLNPGEYVVKSKVTIEVFDAFLKHVQGQSVTITKDNCLPLSQLSEEFGFPSLKAECEDFMKQNQEIAVSDSSVGRICLIEEELYRQESEQLLVLSEFKIIDDRLLSVEKHLSNLQGLLGIFGER
jgi:hypothetical protein